MLYESYKNKLEKRRRTFERLWRFRLLFLLAILLVLAAAAALMGVKGTVTEVSVPEAFSYGEPLSMQASAVFGGAGFEYRLQGTEAWSEKAPRAAGTYECRAIGKTIVGTNRPGDIHLFSIAPAEAVVRVAESSFVYGEAPAFTANLCYDDVLKVEHYTVEERGDFYNVVADLDAVKVLSAEGEDVTSSYLLEAADRDVREVARPITVRTASDAVEYDGLPHTAEALTLEGYGLAAGHHIEAEFLPMVEAGEQTNRPETFRILDENGDDVTEKYAVDYDYGTLEVTKRPLTVTTASASLVYDGTAHTYSDLTAAGLAAGQEAVRGDTLSAQNAGEYKNAPQYDIFDGERRTTDNYAITEEFGTVTVQKRPLTVTTQSYELPYDGEEHLYGDIAAEGLAEEQTIRRTDTLRALDAGEYPNAPQFMIYDGETPTTDNYFITTACGTVRILRRVVEVETASRCFPYDGLPHTEAGFTVLPAQEGRYYLVSGHELTATPAASITNYSETPTPNELAFTVKDGNSDVTNNYDVRTVKKGDLTVERRDVTLLAGSYEGVYDGKPHTAEAWSVEGGSLAEGHAATGTYTPFTDVQSTENNPAEKRILDGAGKDVTFNYNVTWLAGSIVITLRDVTLRAGSYEGVYDGKPHTAEAWSVEGGSLAEGHAAAGAYTAFTDVQSTENDPAEKRILDANGKPVTENYNVTWEAGSIVIILRDVTLRAGSYAGVYDGKPHTAEVWSVKDGSLAEGHSAAGTYTAFTDADRYENDPAEKRILDANGKPVTENYNVTWETGSIVIEKRPLTVTARGGSWEYDAAAHSEAGYDVEGLADGHVFEAKITAPQIVNVWDSRVNDLAFDAVFIGPAGGGDCGKNYDVTYVRTNRIEITRREITVTTKSDAIVYDGTEHTYASAEVTSEKQLAAETHRLVLEDYASFLDARETAYTNAMTVKIYADGEDISGNYTVEVVFGTVKIDRRPITVLTHDRGPYVYDGISWRETDYENCTVDYQDAPKLEGHTVKIEYTGKDGMADVGTHKIAFTVSIIAEVYGEVTENYDVTIAFGEVEITLRPIHIQTQTDEFTYDGKEHAYLEPEVTDNERDAGLAGTQELRIMEGADSHYIFIDARAAAYENRPILRVYDGERDVSANYDWHCDYGTVTIHFRPLHVTSGTKSFVYDDAPHDDRTHTITDTEEDTGLAPDQTLTVIASTVLTDVEEKENKLTYNIADKSNKSVTTNYEIFETAGTISVTKRHVKFLSGSLLNQEYDADPHGAPTYTDLGSDEGPIYKLVKDHAVSATYPTRTVVGREDNVPENVRIVRGGTDVTDNYEIEAWELGTIEILARQVTLQTHSGEFVYDAQPHDVKDFDEVKNTLVSSPAHTHTLEAVYPARTTVGETDNIFEEVVILDENSEPVTGNYFITWEPCGTIKVTARPVTITSDGGTHVYDDEDFSVSAYTVETFNEAGQTGLVEGHEFTATVTVHDVQHDVGTRKNQLRYDDISVTADGAPVTENYTFVYAYAAIEVTPRPVTITTGSGTFVYDGEMHRVNTYEWEKSDGKGRGILTEKGHVFTADEVTNAVGSADVSSFPNIFRLSNNHITVMAGEKNVTGNYSFNDYSWGIVSITPRPVTVTVGGGEKVYNGKPQTCENFEVDKASDYAEETENRERGLVAGHVASPLFPAYIDAGTYVNSVSVSNVRIYGGGYDVTSNYAVTVRYTEDHRFAILRRPITVSDLIGGTWVYDGQPHKSASANFTCEEENGERGLLEGHTFRGAEGVEVTDITDIMEGGVYTQVGYAVNGIKNSIALQQSSDTWYIAYIYDGNGNNVWANYKVEPGTFAPLRIKSPIVVYVFSHTKRYDGTPLTYDPSQENYYIEVFPADVEESGIHVVLGGSLTDVGYLTTEQVGEASRSLCTVTRGESDVTAENRFDFTGPVRALEVQRRLLRVRAADVNVEPTAKTYTYEGDEFSYWFTFGGPLAGHTFTCRVYGVLEPEEEWAVIQLTDIRITDGEGNDVTSYYEVDVTPGTLRWVKADGVNAAAADTKRRVTQ